MTEINIPNHVPRVGSPLQSFGAALNRGIRVSRTQPGTILRVMILVLVGLLFVLIGGVVVTGHVEIGGPIIGGVLFIGFSAAQFGR